MSDGIERRSEMDAEGVRGLLTMNGGAAVAVLAFLPEVLGQPGYRVLALMMVWALPLYQFGMICALLHNRMRRKCSRAWEAAREKGRQPAACEKRWLRWLAPAEPCDCCKSIGWMWGSMVCFGVSAILIFMGALWSL